jgi:hypothetical protein
MNTSKHTPGPWRYSEVNQAVYTDNGEVQICRGLDDFTPEERGNAALISAAPDLLKGCAMALEMLRDPESDYLDAAKLETLLEQAIIKARGA